METHGRVSVRWLCFWVRFWCGDAFNASVRDGMGWENIEKAIALLEDRLFLFLVLCVCAFYRCRRSFRSSSSASVSSLSGSGTQQSTGQTAAHCGSSWKPTHSVHLSGTM